MKVWQLTFYAWDNYSYSGISMDHTLLFSSKEKAVNWAKENNYKIVEYVETIKEVELTEMDTL